QEDEFALMNMGAPSPYLKMAFPNHPCEGDDYLDFRNVSREETERWQQTMLRFLKTIAVRDDRQIVLKSPTHTGRIRVLLELFPDAKFVHIVRDPLEMYASTMKLWPTLWWYQSLHIAKLDNLEDYVFECFDRMYGAFFEQEPLIDSSRICEVRYERLASDTLNEVRRVYDQLDLGDFEAVRPQMEAYLKGLGKYQPNKHEYDAEMIERVMSRWGEYADRYGYRRDALGDS
ncbi:MAG: sulfotransferase, partial [Pirellulales bacterium]